MYENNSRTKGFVLETDWCSAFNFAVRLFRKKIDKSDYIECTLVETAELEKIEGKLAMVTKLMTDILALDTTPENNEAQAVATTVLAGFKLLEGK